MWSTWSWMEKSSLAARWAGITLSQPSGSAPPQIPHCSLIQGILDVPRPLPATPRHFPVPSKHFLTIAPPENLLASPGHTLAPPRHILSLSGTSQHWWRLDLPGSSLHSVPPTFNPPRANRVGRVWDHPQDSGW